MKIIDDNGFVWVFDKGRVQCLEGLLDCTTVEEIESNGYGASSWHDALNVLHDGGYIDLNKKK